MARIKIFTDGAARGNPGPAAAGAVFYNEQNDLLDGFYKSLGKATNNQAEYEAVILALENAIEKYKGSEIVVYLDSQLVCEQLKGSYKVKNHGLAQLFLKAKELIDQFQSIKFMYIPRTQNKEADKLVNDVLDGKVK